MSQDPDQTSPPPDVSGWLDSSLSPPPGPQVTWVDRLTWLGEAKWRIAAITLGVGLVAALTTLALPPLYTARTTLLPPNNAQSGGSAAAAMAGLGGLAGAVGAAKTPDELFVTLLRSDSVVRPLTERFAQQQRHGIRTYEDMRIAMQKFVRITSEKKTGVISIEVDDKDPTFAAKLANAHAEALAQVLDRLAVSEAQQRRVFFAKQLKETNLALLNAEQNLKQLQQTSGLLVPDKQAEAMLIGAAQLRAQIAESEVRLKVLRTSATDQNPEAVRLISELQGLRAELHRLEGGPGNERSARGPLDLAVKALPAAASDYVRALREVKYQEAVFQSMLRQFEAAKLDEAKEGNSAQQVDVAQPPDRKSKPARGLITATTTLLALLLSCVATVWRRQSRLQRMHSERDLAAWQSLVRAWRAWPHKN